jgi:Carboxypeptidase regulatory-like domain
MTKRRIPTRTENKLAVLLAAALALVSACGLQGAEKRKKPAAPQGVVAGTVFREPGFALPSAELTLVPEKAPPKARKLKAVSDVRGEFAFHVPAEEARYTVSVKANGFESQEKSVVVTGEARVDLFFQLKPVAK